MAKANLTVEKVAEDLMCLINPVSQTPKNAFAWLAGRGEQQYLINAGWPGDQVQPPPDYERVCRDAIKVSCHFHSDWIEAWPYLRDNIWLSQKQAAAENCNPQGLGCRPALKRDEMIYAPTPWLTTGAVAPFPVAGIFDDYDTNLGERDSCVIALPCAGHSQTDAAFIHRPSRTLFLGGVYYVGGDIAYCELPDTSIHIPIRSLEPLLQRDDWEYTAQYRGDVYRYPRRYLEEYYDILLKIRDGDIKGQQRGYDWWTLPVFVYPFTYAASPIESTVGVRLLGGQSIYT